jgi:hypothetical protein
MLGRVEGGQSEPTRALKVATSSWKSGGGSRSKFSEAMRGPRRPKGVRRTEGVVGKAEGGSQEGLGFSPY